MPSFLYFAYGSNMLQDRLQVRCPSARACGAGVCMPGEHDIVFCKQSIDGSGKAAMVKIAKGRPLAQIFGVIYEVSVNERDILDRFEGDGYNRDDGVQVTPLGKSTPTAITSYLARPEAVATAIKPYDWYMALVIAGAKQNKLPEDYVKCLDSVPSQRDPYPTRRTFFAAREVLAAAGYPF